MLPFIMYMLEIVSFITYIRVNWYRRDIGITLFLLGSFRAVLSVAGLRHAHAGCRRKN